jgi:thioredoxin reductase (NADPH)
LAGLLGERERAAIELLFSEIERDVPLRLDLGPSSEPVTVLAGGRELDFNVEARRLVSEIAALSERVRLDVAEHGTPGRYPALALGDGLVYHGLPWGHELSSLVYGIADAGRPEPALSPETRAALEGLERDLELEVYVTPT